MKVCLKLAFAERTALRLLNWLAEENARILRVRPDLPGLYEAGVRYEREPNEVWCDYLTLLAVGHENCDGLSAARAGELLARGGRALSPTDGGYRRGRRLRSIPAEVLLLTRSGRLEPGQYHCIVRYRVGKRWYRDDPSARLGMPAPAAFAGAPRAHPTNPTRSPGGASCGC